MTMHNALEHRQFASDNYAGICPEVWEALGRANYGHAIPYGEDKWTAQACDMLRALFETDGEVFFVFNGTAANSLALASLCQSYHSVLCAETAHVETDECGAPQFFSNGTKILLVKGDGGKVDPAEVEYVARKRSDIHYPKPKVLSLTQPTELGTVYTLEELEALGERARFLGLRLHMDGARFANAVASLDVAPGKLAQAIGLDVLCLGGIKNGMSTGEAVIFFKRELAHEFEYRCKQAGQLASKMRFMAAQWIGMLSGGAWLRNARMAGLLEQRIEGLPGLRIMFPVQANSVFVEMPPELIDALHTRGWHFYTFIGQGGGRFMCSWDTTEADVSALVQDMHDLLPPS